MKRRHALWLLAALPGCRTEVPVREWRGICFGIPVTISFAGIDPSAAEKLGDEALQIARRLEASFTLWDEQSELRRLNRDLVLEHPSAALLDLLKKAKHLYEMTGGTFDPSIHSYLAWAKSEHAEGRIPDPLIAEKKRALVDFSRVKISAVRIELEPGMALSLNAIAQGYATDRVTEFLEKKQLSALVNFGEYRVAGRKSWTVTVEGRPLSIAHALAVSSGSGERLSATSAANHLIDPATGASPPPRRVIAVEAPEAWLADGMATVIALGYSVEKDDDSLTVHHFIKR